MDAEQIRQVLLKELQLRVGPEMGRYVLEMSASGGGPIAIMGGDARTGWPMRRMVPVELLMESLRATSRVQSANASESTQMQ